MVHPSDRVDQVAPQYLAASASSRVIACSCNTAVMAAICSGLIVIFVDFDMILPSLVAP